MEKNTDKNVWTEDQLMQVLNASRRGARQCDIAKSYGVTPCRIGQVIAQAKRIEAKKISTDPFDSLGARAKNCLLAEGIKTIDQIRSVLDGGEMHKLPNIGKATVSEIRLWLDNIDEVAKCQG